MNQYTEEYRFDDDPLYNLHAELDDSYRGQLEWSCFRAITSGMHNTLVARLSSDLCKELYDEEA